MKFSTILTSAFFALFIFTATSVSATDISMTSNEKAQTLDAKKTVILEILGERIDVSTHSSARISGGGNQLMSVKIMKGLQVVAQEATSSTTLSFDIGDFEPGMYLVIVETGSGVERGSFRVE